MYVFEFYTPTAEKALIGCGAVLGILIIITAITVCTCAAVVRKYRKWKREYHLKEQKGNEKKQTNKLI